jgi:hypothetical protein
MIDDPVLYALLLEQTKGVSLPEMIECLDAEIAMRCSTARVLTSLGDSFDMDGWARKSHVLESAMRLLERINGDEELRKAIVWQLKKRKFVARKAAEATEGPLEVPF